MPAHSKPSASRDLIARFAAIVGPDNAISDPAEQAPYLKEWRDLYVGRTPLIVKPGSTDEVSRVRAGRLFRLQLTAENAEAALERASKMADQLLANPVIEQFSVDVEPIKE